jgi:transposase InsO family protein
MIGEFTRTRTMADLVTARTGNASIRNNAPKWIGTAVTALQGRFPFPPLVFDSDNGSAFINHDVADWLQERDVAQTRSRPYKKNDQATAESKDNHVVRKRSFHSRYTTTEELALLGELWPLFSMRLNFSNPTSLIRRCHARRATTPCASWPIPNSRHL